MRQAIQFLALCGLIIALSGRCSPALTVISLDLELVAPDNLQVFFLQDLNISGEAPAALVFRITLTSSEPNATRCTAYFTMLNSGRAIVEGWSDPFMVQPGTTFLTNLDLTAKNSPYQLHDYDNTDEALEIQDRLLETGYFPSGTYQIRLALRDASSGDEIDTDEVTAVVTNPFNILLVSPPGTPAAPTALSMTTPVFAWSSAATQFAIKICELTSTDMDVESVLQGRPHYERDRANPIFGQSFLYPTAGVRPLEPNHTYYWQVIPLVQTSHGLQEYPSAVGAFTIQATPGDPQGQRILLALQRILGSAHAGILNELTYFQPNGSLRLDGASLSVEELEAMAAQFEQNACRVTSARIE